MWLLQNYRSWKSIQIISRNYDQKCFPIFQQVIVIGIPFAAPPVGKLRFLKPSPVVPWDGVLDLSHKMTVLCNQWDTDVGSEDCLYLNVYVPANEDNVSSLAVMVWIFGGGFNYGSGTWDEYGPQMFMDTQQVVMVSE